jgi:hypothetical protein
MKDDRSFFTEKKILGREENVHEGRDPLPMDMAPGWRALAGDWSTLDDPGFWTGLSGS